MSLRSFHIVFIVTALGLLAFLTAWAGRRVLAGADGADAALALASLTGLAVGLPYLLWFLRKADAQRA